MDDGGKRRGQLVCALPFEIVGSSRVASGKYLARVTERHSDYRLHEDLLSFGRSLFGGAVHANFKRVYLRTHSNHAQPLAHSTQLFRQQNLDGCVLQEPVRTSGEDNGIAGAYCQCFLQAGGDLVVAQPCATAFARSSNLLLDLVPCRLGQGYRTNESYESNNVHHFFHDES